MRYREARKINGGSCYAVVNESLAIWDEMLKDVTGVKKAASICSGGEVAFFNILPKVEEQLDLIDNSLGSMYYAIGKYHIINKLGAEKGLELLKHAQREYDSPHDAGYYDRQGHYRYPKPKQEGPSWECFRMFEEANGKIGNARGDNAFTTVGNQLARFYGQLPLERVKALRANRSKVNFIHGDLSDLADGAPYDFLYLSNALDYGIHNPTPKSGEKRGYEVYKVTEWVKPGGYIALTGHSGRRVLEDRVVLRTSKGLGEYGTRGKRQPSEISWTYRLLKNELDPNYKKPKSPQYITF